MIYRIRSMGAAVVGDHDLDVECSFAELNGLGRPRFKRRSIATIQTAENRFIVSFSTKVARR